MKTAVLGDNFTPVIHELTRITPRRSTLPILAEIHAANVGGRLALTAGDLETTVTAYVGAQIEGNDPFMLPAKELKKMLPAKELKKMLPALKADRIDFSTNGHGTTTLKAGPRTITLHGSKPDDYPPTPEASEALGEIDAQALYVAIERTAFCAQDNTNRPILNGINVQAKDNKIVICAADGYRLALFNVQANYHGEPFEANIPLNAANTLARLLKMWTRDGERVAISRHPKETVIKFSCGRFDLVSQLTQGTYPNYLSLIPDSADQQYTATLDRDTFLQEIETAYQVAKVGAGIVRLRAAPGLNGSAHLTISSKAEESSAFESEIQVPFVGPAAADSAKIAFNGQFMIDFLRHLSGSPFELRWDGPERPYTISRDEAGVYVCMPMFVKWNSR